MLASVGRQGDLRLWNATQHLSEGKPLLCKNDAAFAVAFSPDSKTVAVGYSGGTVRVWDVLSHQQIGEPLKGDFSSDIKSVAFSHDGSLLAAASSDGRGVQLWDMSKRLPFGDPLDGGSDNEATSVAFSPDDKLLAVANSDGTTWLWDLERDSWASMLCSLANRNLSDGEWKQFFGAKVTYRRTCRNLPPGESEVMGQQGSKN
jgi:WD40 repeat protein